MGQGLCVSMVDAKQILMTCNGAPIQSPPCSIASITMFALRKGPVNCKIGPVNDCRVNSQGTTVATNSRLSGHWVGVYQIVIAWTVIPFNYWLNLITNITMFELRKGPVNDCRVNSQGTTGATNSGLSGCLGRCILDPIGMNSNPIQPLTQLHNHYHDVWSPERASQ